MYHTPLTLYEQENLEHKFHFEAWPQSSVVFVSLHVVSWITKTLRVGPTGRYRRSKNRFLSSLRNSVRGLKGKCCC
jgi:hypothetical protein